MGEESTPPEERLQSAYEQAESRMARAAEQLVARPSFGELLAMATENVVALTRMGNDALDLALRNLRLVGRQDVIALQRQLARTEDKLERVLQEVERLERRLGDDDDGAPASARARRTSATPRNGSAGRRPASRAKSR